MERSIELLAFYLILANLYGSDLKTALTELVVAKPKRILYGNMVLLLVYPLAIAFIVQMTRQQLGWQNEGYIVDHALQHLIAHILLRQSFNLRKALLTFIFSAGVATIGGVFAFIFVLNTQFTFLWILSIVMLMCYHSFFEGLYVRLIRKSWLINTVTLFSFVIYFTAFFGFSENFTMAVTVSASTILLTASALFLMTPSYLKKETWNTVQQIKRATPNSLFDTLKDLSAEHMESDVACWYIIKHHNVVELVNPLNRKLKFQCRRGIIKDYELHLTKEQIKINVIR